MIDRRQIFIILFCILSYILFDTWHKDHAPAEPVPQAEVSAKIEDHNVPIKSHTAGVQSEQAKINHKNTLQSQDIVTVKTDVMQIYIDLQGGNFVGNNLLKYPISIEDKSPLKLLNSADDTYYVANSGLASELGPDTNNVLAKYTTAQKEYKLADNAQELTVDFTWEKNGIKVIKQFIFTAKSYVVDVKYTVINNSQNVWEGYVFAQLRRKELPAKRSMLGFSTFSGPAIYSSQNKYKAFAVSSIKKDPAQLETEGGWLAMVQQYFVSSWIPAKDQKFDYRVSVVGDDIVLGNMIGPDFSVAPTQQKSTSLQFYSGPEILKDLDKAATGMDRTIDFGFFWPISYVLLIVMQYCYKFLHNWGAAIIAVTVLIKIVFYKFSSSSYRSMAKMKKLQPKIEQLKLRYGDDKQKMGPALMELYKKEKVNPMGGCLPMLVQFPFFLGLYGVIIESVQLRQASFLWISDLSVKDPYFIMPILTGITMLVQQLISPQTQQDETQRNMMMLLPIVFTATFLFFPAGLVLYWTVNNALSIAHQLWVTRQEEAVVKST